MIFTETRTDLVPQRGVRFHIHPPDTPARMNTEGAAVAPGLHAFVGIDKTKVFISYNHIHTLLSVS